MSDHYRRSGIRDKLGRTVKSYWQSVIEAAENRQKAFGVAPFFGLVFGATFLFEGFGEGKEWAKTVLRIGSLAASVTALVTFLVGPAIKEHTENRKERNDAEKERRKQESQHHPRRTWRRAHFGASKRSVEQLHGGEL
jgi:hypothetical protein